jgi:hypothetical protein
MAINRYNKEHPTQPDEITGALVTIDTDHQSIHKGAVFSLSVWDTAIVDTGTLALGFEVPADLRVAVKGCHLFGTYLTPNNHNVDPSAPASLVKVNLNPTNLPTVFPMGFVFGGGTGVAGTGQSAVGELSGEFGFSAGKHCIVLTNLTGATGLGQIRLNWIERHTY